MKRAFLPLILAMLAGLTAAGTPGCSTMNERQSLYGATQIYTSTMNSLATLREAGVLDQDEVETINEVEPTVYEALQEWRRSLRTEGESPEDAIAKFERGLKLLRKVATRNGGQTQGE